MNHMLCRTSSGWYKKLVWVLGFGFWNSASAGDYCNPRMGITLPSNSKFQTNGIWNLGHGRNSNSSQIPTVWNLEFQMSLGPITSQS
jgi:hypothetical protein